MKLSLGRQVCHDSDMSCGDNCYDVNSAYKILSYFIRKQWGKVGGKDIWGKKQQRSTHNSWISESVFTASSNKKIMVYSISVTGDRRCKENPRKYYLSSAISDPMDIFSEQGIILYVLLRCCVYFLSYYYFW